MKGQDVDITVLDLALLEMNEAVHSGNCISGALF